MFYPPHNAWSYINTCAAVTVGTWVELPKDCRTELINTFRDVQEWPSSSSFIFATKFT